MTDAHNTDQHCAPAYRQARQFRLPLLPLPRQGRHLALLKFPPVGRLGELLFFGLRIAAGSASVGSRESVVYRVPTDHVPAAACSARSAAPAGRWLFATRAALFAPAQPQGGDREVERTTHVRRKRWQRQRGGQVVGVRPKPFITSRSAASVSSLRRSASAARFCAASCAICSNCCLRCACASSAWGGNSGRGCNEGRTRHT